MTLEERRDALLVEVKLIVSILGERSGPTNTFWTLILTHPNWAERHPYRLRQLLDAAWQQGNTSTTP